MEFHDYMAAKLLICITGRHAGEKLVDAAKAAGARGGTITLGRAQASSRLLQMLALGDILVDVVFFLTADETEAVSAAICATAAAKPRKFQGILATLDVSRFFVRMQPGQAPRGETGREKMQSDFVLIGVIVNSGFGDDVMSAARTAGAQGGTILNARGTGREEDVKFFGIKLVPEKEMVLIFTEREKSDAILASIGALPELSKPGGGVFYCMDVERFAPLGDMSQSARHGK